MKITQCSSVSNLRRTGCRTKQPRFPHVTIYKFSDDPYTFSMFAVVQVHLPYTENHGESSKGRRIFSLYINRATV